MIELDADDLLRRLGLAIKRINALKAENGRLKAPVSHEEWCMHSIQCEAEHVGKFVMERVDFDDILAARAQQPSPQDKCVCGHPHGPDGSCTVCVSCIYTPRTNPAQDKEQG